MRIPTSQDFLDVGTLFVQSFVELGFNTPCLGSSTTSLGFFHKGSFFPSVLWWFGAPSPWLIPGAGCNAGAMQEEWGVLQREKPLGAARAESCLRSGHRL